MKMNTKTARINAGFNTQDNAGIALGVSGDTVGNWERGKSFPNIKMIPKIEEVYKISYDNIIFLSTNND